MTTPRSIRNIALVGFMGAGKTSAGRLAASRLGFRFLDTDHLIETRTGRSIPEIFATEGEPRFRAYESDVVHELEPSDRCVISTGGGLILHPDNLESLRTHCLVICLWSSPEKTYERVRYQSNRPLLHGPDPQEKIRQLLRERAPSYQRADILINTDSRSLAEVVDHILHHFRLATREGA